MSTEQQQTTTQKLVQTILQQGGQDAYEYLAETFLVEAVQALLEARLEAELTQAEVAHQLKTRQPAIARWESDFDGSISLRKYIEFALACGKIPCDLLLIPADEMLQFALVHTSEIRTADKVSKWKEAMNPS